MKTTSLAQSKKLRELGVTVASEKMWWQAAFDDDDEWVLDHSLRYGFGCYNDCVNAYDAEELLGMIKGALDMYRDGAEIYGVRSMYIGSSDTDTWYSYGATLTEALANKLIYDLENGIVSIVEVNK